MNFFRELEAVPAYYAGGAGGNSIPFIVALLLHDSAGRPVLTPAVEAAINRTAEITNRDGLIIAIVTEQDTRATVANVVGRAMKIDGAILLFRCQNGEVAEALMLCMSQLFDVKLVKECGSDYATRVAKHALAGSTSTPASRGRLGPYSA